jgi:hypothetical protein
VSDATSPARRARGPSIADDAPAAFAAAGRQPRAIPRGRRHRRRPDGR